VKAALKRFAGQALFGLGLEAVLLRGTAVIVAFHRVQPAVDEGDGLSVSIEAFARFCRFFRRHFRVAPLRTLVEKLERGQPLGRELAITFDDGYRDNFLHAAPVLEALGLPATFFVVAQWIGTDVVPWWDGQRAARYAWMSWDEVRDLRARGFEIGAHTLTHADLGRVSGAEAERELCGARAILEDRLAAPVDLFAYPYGGPHHITERNRARVRAAGFRCCCSSFGGVNRTGDSAFHLQRVPVSSWHASAPQLGLEVALRRSRVDPAWMQSAPAGEGSEADSAA
jgi:peptidoglycan/xylan/chitin deacetylase (PgdA/CDA1 family)